MAVINGTGIGEPLNGTDDPDFINGFGGDDEIRGYGGDDVIDGGAGADDLYGGSGADRFVLSRASDSPTSLIDSDYIGDFEGGTDQLDLTLITGANSLVKYFVHGGLFFLDQNGDGAYDSLIRVADLRGTDVLSNMTSGFLFEGMGEMWGTAGNDTMLGWHTNTASDHNMFYGGLGGDFMDGGSNSVYDRDTFLYQASAESSLGNPDTIVFDSSDSPVSGDTLDLSYLSSVGGRIVIVDDAANNSFIYLDDGDNGTYEGMIISHGQVRGHDIAGGSPITYLGTSGADSFTGGSGDDVLAGYGGADFLKGGNGADMLYGGAGNDTFLYDDSKDTLLAAYDVIFDFQSGSDKIDITGLGSFGGVFISHFGGSSFVYLDYGYDNTADALILVYDELIAYSDVAGALYTVPADPAADSLLV